MEFPLRILTQLNQIVIQLLLSEKGKVWVQTAVGIYRVLKGEHHTAALNFYQDNICEVDADHSTSESGSFIEPNQEAEPLRKLKKKNLPGFKIHEKKLVAADS